MHFYKELIDEVRLQEGRVRAYVPHTAGSAAAFLLPLVDEINLVERTEVVLHRQATITHVPFKEVLLLTTDGALMPAQLCTREYVPVEEECENDRNVMRDFLLTGLAEGLRAQVHAALQGVFDDPSNKRDEIRMTGKELAGLGRVKAFVKSKDLRAQFFRDTGVHVPSNPDVRRVWAEAEDPSYL